MTIGLRLLLIVSDPWEAYKKVEVRITHSFTEEGVPYFLVENCNESSEKYFVSSRHVNEELSDVFQNNGVCVFVYLLKASSSLSDYSEGLKNSHYFGIGSIELCP
jgi:hypothetical protein